MTTKWEILVVGAGPAGIAAAVCAAEQGKSVCIVDDNPDIGGQIWRGEHGNPLASTWYRRLDDASVARLSGWRIFARPDLAFYAPRNPESTLTSHTANSSWQPEHVNSSYHFPGGLYPMFWAPALSRPW